MSTAADKRRATLLKKYGSADGLRKHYQEMQKKSRLKYSGDGGFRALSKEERTAVAKKAAEARWGKREAND